MSPRPLALRLTVALAALTAASACGDRRIDDSELGSLVTASTDETRAVDIDAAARDVGELRHALATPHTTVSAVLGAHTVTASSSVKVESGGAVVNEISEKTVIRFDADGNFAATSDNDRSYGRHAIFVDDTLYLRPRYGKYHGRAPAAAGEPGAIRDEMFSAASAYFELLYSRLELSDRGNENVAGRPARKIDFKMAPAPGERDSEPLAHKKWRESITVEKAEGSLSLDEEAGFALAARVTGTITFVKGSKRFTMEITAEHTIDAIGKTAAITAPPADDVVSAPTVRSEVDEQQQLLDGLSPAGAIGTDKK